MAPAVLGSSAGLTVSPCMQVRGTAAYLTLLGKLLCSRGKIHPFFLPKSNCEYSILEGRMSKRGEERENMRKIKNLVFFF